MNDLRFIGDSGFQIANNTTTGVGSNYLSEAGFQPLIKAALGLGTISVPYVPRVIAVVDFYT